MCRKSNTRIIAVMIDFGELTQSDNPFFSRIAGQTLLVGAEQYAPFDAGILMTDHGEQTRVHAVVGTAEAECLKLGRR